MAFGRTLIGRVTMVAVPAAIVVILAVSTVVYHLSYKEVLSQRVDLLRERTVARVHRQMGMFNEISASQRLSVETFQETITGMDPAAAAETFDHLFPKFGDGTRRSMDALFDGMAAPSGVRTFGMAAFLPRADTIDDQRRARIMAAYETVRRIGPTRPGRTPNYWFFSTAGDIVVFAPDRPDQLMPYRRDLPSDFSFADMELAKLVTVEAAPARDMQCGSLSPMVYDRDGPALTASCQTPVDDAQGRHIGSFGVTLPLTGWMNATVQVPFGETHRFILYSERYGLLAHTALDTITSQDDVSVVAEAEQLDRLVTAMNASQGVFEDAATDSIVAYAMLGGPDWILLAVKPKASIVMLAASAALKAAAAMALLGAVLVLMVSVLIFRTIARPLRRLAYESENGVEGSQHLLGVSERHDEIGLLGRALMERDARVQNMVENLESRVAERTEELERAKRAAESANEAKTAFLATMSHEIRTPMNGVIGMAEALGQTALDTDQQEYLAVMTRSGQTLLALIDDILDIAKIEAGKLIIEPEETAPAEVIDEVCGLYTAIAASKGLCLKKETSRLEGKSLYTDALRLRQILSNLISNALKFTEHGEVRVEADMSAQGQLTVTVSDTGPGIAEPMQDAIFRKFEQAETSTTRRFGGTGLGLAISQELAVLLGGSISVQSSLGEGSTFTLTVQSLQHAAASSPAQETASHDDQDHEEILEGMRLLVAEDLAVNQQVLAAVCQPLGVSLTMANNGREAIEFLKANTFDAVLMDLRMPVMDGLEAIGRIRAGEAGDAQRSIPIIALSANAMREHVQESRAAGADDHVAKPVSRLALAAALAKFQKQAPSSRPERAAPHLTPCAEPAARRQSADD